MSQFPYSYRAIQTRRAILYLTLPEAGAIIKVLIRGRSTAGQQPLELLIEVRILAPELFFLF